ncbi:hypothetical protein GCM10023088_20640 [Actinomadura verrucosospora]
MGKRSARTREPAQVTSARDRAGAPVGTGIPGTRAPGGPIGPRGDGVVPAVAPMPPKRIA